MTSREIGLEERGLLGVGGDGFISGLGGRGWRGWIEGVVVVLRGVGRGGDEVG